MSASFPAPVCHELIPRRVQTYIPPYPEKEKVYVYPAYYRVSIPGLYDGTASSRGINLCPTCGADLRVVPEDV